jgi:hypothetical protein
MLSLLVKKIAVPCAVCHSAATEQHIASKKWFLLADCSWHFLGFIYVGVEHVLMCNNSELRALYDLYCQQDIPWMHYTEYHKNLEKRPSFGMLSMQFWIMMIDGCVLSPMLPLSTVNSILKQCCKAPAAILERRKAVLQSPSYPGVWTYDLPDHSPYQVHSRNLRKQNQ